VSVYNKTLDVIGSCNNRAQLKVAEKYLKLASKYVDSYGLMLLNWALETKRATL
jgi:hypothetical protein